MLCIAKGIGFSTKIEIIVTILPVARFFFSSTLIMYTIHLIHFDVTQMNSIWSIRFHNINWTLKPFVWKCRLLGFSLLYMCYVFYMDFHMPIEFIFHLNDFVYMYTYACVWLQHRWRFNWTENLMKINNKLWLCQRSDLLFMHKIKCDMIAHTANGTCST